MFSAMDRKARSLGEFIKASREAKGLSLRAVEQATGISNSYLSQLESDKIKQPTPITLHKLSKVYGVPYSALMTLAGYPVPGSDDIASSKAGLAARVGPITSHEEEALIEYLEFLRSRRKRGGR